MSWNDFVSYLQEKIISLNKNTTQEEYNLTPFAKEKYGAGLSEEQIFDLEANLNYLIASYQQRFNTLYSDFHVLPEIEKEADEEEEESNIPNSSNQKEEIKTWTELYPARQDCLLGKIENGAVSWETYNLLGRIYGDWWLLREKTEELKQKAEEWEKKSKKLMEEWVSQKAQSFFRKKGIKVLEELKQWMADYESLDEKRQGELEEEHKNIKKQLEFLEVETSSKREEKGWLKNLDWTSIAVSTGIGVILILFVLIIRRYLKS